MRISATPLSTTSPHLLLRDKEEEEEESIFLIILALPQFL